MLYDILFYDIYAMQEWITLLKQWMIAWYVPVWTVLLWRAVLYRCAVGILPLVHNQGWQISWRTPHSDKWGRGTAQEIPTSATTQRHTLITTAKWEKSMSYWCIYSCMIKSHSVFIVVLGRGGDCSYPWRIPLTIHKVYLEVFIINEVSHFFLWFS